ncbi:hypothetical protein HY623_01345 [Candidatus Uhrbacteria bacterium]|nr:hypothetical protein [Candidatus Uhrbacteria bacterium]
MKNIPKNWRPFFWFCDPEKIDLTQDRYIVIHTLLAYGSIADIRQLEAVYGKRSMRASFLKPYRGFYSAPAFSFAKFFLNAPSAQESLYVKTIGPASRIAR